MSFRKRIITVIIIACLVLVTVYVGNKNNAAEEESKSLSYYQSETINLWYSDDSLTDLFTNAAVAFNEKYSDFRVIPTLVSSEEYLEAINEASIANEDLPDIYVLTNDSLEKAYLSGLASEVDKDDLVINSNHFSDGAINAVTYSNKKVAYPLYFETSVLVYNIDYLKEWAEQVNAGDDEDELTDEQLEELDASQSEGDESDATDEEVTIEHDGEVTYLDGIPQTFEDITNFSKEFDAPDGVDGIIEWDVKDIFYNYFFVGNYLSVGGETGDDISQVDISNDNTVACLETYQNLSEFFSIDADETDYATVLDDFKNGKYVFTIVTSDAIKDFEEAKAQVEAENAEAAANGEAVEETTESTEESDETTETTEESEETVEEAKSFDYGYALIPDLSADLKSRSLSVTDCLVINGYSEKKEGAKAFAEFMCLDYADQIYQRSGKLAASVDAGYTEDAMTVFQGEYAKSMPLSKIVEASNLWVQLEVLFKEVWDGADVKTELDTLQNQLSLQISNE